MGVKVLSRRGKWGTGKESFNLVESENLRTIDVMLYLKDK